MASPRSVKSEAHDAYLRGRYHWNKGTEKEYREAKRYFEQAAEIDPTYAAAFAGLAALTIGPLTSCPHEWLRQRPLVMPGRL